MRIAESLVRFLLCYRAQAKVVAVVKATHKFVAYHHARLIAFLPRKRYCAISISKGKYSCRSFAISFACRGALRALFKRTY